MQMQTRQCWTGGVRRLIAHQGGIDVVHSSIRWHDERSIRGCRCTAAAAVVLFVGRRRTFRFAVAAAGKRRRRVLVVLRGEGENRTFDQTMGARCSSEGRW